MDELESVSSPDGLDEMVSDALGPNDSTESVATAPEPSVSTPEPVEAQAQEPSPVQEVAASPTPVQPPPTPQSVRIGNRDYTAQEIEALETTKQQFTHLQQKHMNMLEERARAQQPQGQPEQAQFTPQAYMEQVRQKYDPVVKKYAEQGLMSSDFVTLFPQEAAQMAYYSDRFSHAEQVMRALASETQQRAQREQSNGVVNELGRTITSLAQSGEPFAPLKDPAKVQEFVNFLWETNPPMSQLRDPGKLAGYWVAFNKDQYLQTAQTKQVADQRAQQARLARADATGGTRAPGVMQSAEKSPLDEMVEDFLDRGRG